MDAITESQEARVALWEQAIRDIQARDWPQILKDRALAAIRERQEACRDAR